MIFVNGKQVDFTKFPDGTTSFRFDIADDFHSAPAEYRRYSIKWHYDGDNECILLWYLVNHIRSVIGRDTVVELIMPYIPNARMDRVKTEDEVFTLKWFAGFINSLCLDRVVVIDPHSSVSSALINNIQVVDPKEYVDAAVSIIEHELENECLLMCYPDEGAAKRYSDLMDAEYVFGIKHRNWRSGEIERLELTSPEKVAGRNVLIVDDICSRGGTFTNMAKALKEVGAKNIYLYVSHCENTIFNGSVLTDGMICKVFTTNSIYRGSHEKIIVLKVKE